VFERFTDRARRVVVLAQEEARLLNHNYIGTEHLLLGLIHEGEGVASQALTSIGISLEDVRQQVQEVIGEGKSAPMGHIPFTPRAKKVLELSLREALQLKHNYIGTEHVLLGLVAEGEGVAAQVLVKMGATLPAVRSEVLKMLQGYQGVEQGVEVGPESPPEGGSDGPRCPRCRVLLEDSVTYRVLDVRPVDEVEGEPRAVAFAFCDRCGTWLGTLN
jgi:ATP-dependent Clp protease ATP-binding subunit ClpC